jgi:hypothetical protein
MMREYHGAENVRSSPTVNTFGSADVSTTARTSPPSPRPMRSKTWPYAIQKLRVRSDLHDATTPWRTHPSLKAFTGALKPAKYQVP